MGTQENLNKFKIGVCHNVGNCTHVGERQAIPSDVANSGGFKCKWCGMPLKEEQKPKSFWEKYGKIVMIAAAVIIVVGAIIFLISMKGDSKTEDSGQETGQVEAVDNTSTTPEKEAVKANDNTPAPVTKKDREMPAKVDPPYGRYTGDRNSQGQPDGFGDIEFTKHKLVTGEIYAEPGYVIRNARFVNGKLQSGTLYDTDGNKVCFVDANNNL